MKKILAILLALMLVVCNLAVAFAASYTIDTAKSSVVRVVTHFTVDPGADSPYAGAEVYATGSGFLVGDINADKASYIVTAGHVIMHNVESGNVAATTALLIDNNGNEKYYAVAVDKIEVFLTDSTSNILSAQEAGYSERADVALIRLNEPLSTSRRSIAVLLDKNDFEIGETLTSMGFPASAEVNYSDSSREQLRSTTDDVVTNHGNFSRFSTHAVTGVGDMILCTADMDKGMSGGPLVTNDGYVVGVVNSGASSNNNVNYAVATSEVKRLLNSQTDAKYTEGPLQTFPSTMMLIIIAAAVVIIILLVIIILVNSKNKKELRSLVFVGTPLVNGKTTVELKKGTKLIVGRGPGTSAETTYPPDTAGVSRTHCTITYDGKQVSVTDNNSRCGTFIGGQQLTPGVTVVMHRGQKIQFGNSNSCAAELH